MTIEGFSQLLELNFNIIILFIVGFQNNWQNLICFLKPQIEKENQPSVHWFHRISCKEGFNDSSVFLFCRECSWFHHISGPRDVRTTSSTGCSASGTCTVSCHPAHISTGFQKCTYMYPYVVGSISWLAVTTTFLVMLASALFWSECKTYHFWPDQGQKCLAFGQIHFQLGFNYNPISKKRKSRTKL